MSSNHPEPVRGALRLLVAQCPVGRALRSLSKTRDDAWWQVSPAVERIGWKMDGRQRMKSKNNEGHWDGAQLVCLFQLWLVQPRFFFHQAAEVMNVAVANEQGSAWNLSNDRHIVSGPEWSELSVRSGHFQWTSFLLGGTGVVFLAASSRSDPQYRSNHALALRIHRACERQSTSLCI